MARANSQTHGHQHSPLPVTAPTPALSPGRSASVSVPRSHLFAKAGQEAGWLYLRPEWARVSATLGTWLVSHWPAGSTPGVGSPAAPQNSRQWGLRWAPCPSGCGQVWERPQGPATTLPSKRSWWGRLCPGRRWPCVPAEAGLLVAVAGPSRPGTWGRAAGGQRALAQTRGSSERFQREPRARQQSPPWPCPAPRAHFLSGRACSGRVSGGARCVASCIWRLAERRVVTARPRRGAHQRLPLLFVAERRRPV